MKIEQLPLWNQDGSKKRTYISWSGSQGEWFYVEHRDNPHRVLYADEKGNFYYGDRDLTTLIPVVWNLRREARRVSNHHKGRVKVYPYRLKA